MGGAGVDVGRSGSARLRRAPRSKHTTAPVSTAPPPPVPWQFTGNHWLTVPCIHPADGAVMHPVPTVPRVIDQKYRIEQLLGSDDGLKIFSSIAAACDSKSAAHG